MESGDISAENNNTLDKSKNGNMSPEPDTNTLYSNGEILGNKEFWSHLWLFRSVQVDWVRCSLRWWDWVPEAHGDGARVGRQEHRPGPGPDADRLPARAPASEGGNFANWFPSHPHDVLSPLGKLTRNINPCLGLDSNVFFIVKRSGWCFVWCCRSESGSRRWWHTYILIRKR